MKQIAVKSTKYSVPDSFLSSLQDMICIGISEYGQRVQIFKFDIAATSKVKLQEFKEQLNNIQNHPHPNIIRLFAHQKAENFYYVVFECTNSCYEKFGIKVEERQSQQQLQQQQANNCKLEQQEVFQTQKESTNTDEQQIPAAQKHSITTEQTRNEQSQIAKQSQAVEGTQEQAQSQAVIQEIKRSDEQNQTCLSAMVDIFSALKHMNVYRFFHGRINQDAIRVKQVNSLVIFMLDFSNIGDILKPSQPRNNIFEAPECSKAPSYRSTASDLYSAAISLAMLYLGQTQAEKVTDKEVVRQATEQLKTKVGTFPKMLQCIFQTCMNENQNQRVLGLDQLLRSQLEGLKTFVSGRLQQQTKTQKDFNFQNDQLAVTEQLRYMIDFQPTLPTNQCQFQTFQCKSSDLMSCTAFMEDIVTDNKSNQHMIIDRALVNGKQIIFMQQAVGVQEFCILMTLHYPDKAEILQTVLYILVQQIQLAVGSLLDVSYRRLLVVKASDTPDWKVVYVQDYFESKKISPQDFQNFFLSLADILHVKIDVQIYQQQGSIKDFLASVLKQLCLVHNKPKGILPNLMFWQSDEHAQKLKLKIKLEKELRLRIIIRQKNIVLAIMIQHLVQQQENNVLQTRLGNYIKTPLQYNCKMYQIHVSIINNKRIRLMKMEQLIFVQARANKNILLTRLYDIKNTSEVVDEKFILDTLYNYVYLQQSNNCFSPLSMFDLSVFLVALYSRAKRLAQGSNASSFDQILKDINICIDDILSESYQDKILVQIQAIQQAIIQVLRISKELICKQENKKRFHFFAYFSQNYLIQKIIANPVDQQLYPDQQNQNYVILSGSVLITLAEAQNGNEDAKTRLSFEISSTFDKYLIKFSKLTCESENKLIKLVCRQCTYANIKMLLSNNQKQIQTRQSAETSKVLFDVVKNGNAEILYLLLKQANTCIFEVDDFGNTLLHVAVMFHQFQCVKLLLPDIPSSSLKNLINRQNKQGYTATMLAVIHNFPEAAKHLIESEKCKFNKNNETALIMAVQRQSLMVSILIVEARQRGNYGLTALMIAAKKGFVDAVKQLKLLESTMTDDHGYTALMHAVQNNEIECATELIESESKKQNKDGQTALMIAVQNENYQIAKLLAPTESKFLDQNGESALMMAVQRRQHDLIVLLIDEAGMQNAKGHTALMIAAFSGFEDGVNLLLQKEAKMQSLMGKFTALMYAAQFNMFKCVELLQVECRKQNDEGMTALMIATRSGHIKCVELLLNEIELVDNTKSTALMHASKSQNASCVSLLMKQVNLQNQYGQCALSFAIQNGDCAIIEMLIQEVTICQSSFDKLLMTIFEHENVSLLNKIAMYSTFLLQLNQKKIQKCQQLMTNKSIIGNQFAMSRLMFATVIGDLDSVKILKDTELRQQSCHESRKGNTALMYAAESNCIECVKELIDEAGMQKENGETAYIIAMRNKYQEIAELLAPYESQINVQGLTALMVSARNGDVENVRVCKCSQLKQQSIQSGKMGFTALMYAAEQNQRDCAVELLEEVGMQNDNGDTALVIAIKNSNTKMIELLAPYEKQIKNRNNEYPIILACRNKNCLDQLSVLILDPLRLTKIEVGSVIKDYNSQELYTVENVQQNSIDPEYQEEDIGEIFGATLDIIDRNTTKFLCKVSVFMRQTISKYFEEQQTIIQHHCNIEEELTKIYYFDKNMNMYVFSIITYGISLEQFLLTQTQQYLNNNQIIIDVTKIIFDVCKAAQTLQSLQPRIIHRDIKPENIIIVGNLENWQAVLVDFVRGDTNNYSVMVGTVGYIAPEVVKTNYQYTNKSDCYSLGKTIKWIISKFSIHLQQMRWFDDMISGLTEADPNQRWSIMDVIYTIGLNGGHKKDANELTNSQTTTGQVQQTKDGDT